jgi:predicted AAA+ superfamily ATPase
MSESERFYAQANALLDRIESLLPPEAEAANPDSCIAFRWRRHGLRGRLYAVSHPSTIRLDDLRCIDRQKQAIVRNTRQFLASLPANNALLWGPRGTGKSSLLKAVLNEFASSGLRLVEVVGPLLADLPEILEKLPDDRLRYIIYCDDLSFEANDPSYKSLKVTLDGSVNQTPDNVLVYATSNRRHLLPEYQRDNLETRLIDGELHHGEAVEERISLSERFGLWLAFHPFSQDDYLHIAGYWLERFGLQNFDETVQRAALQWALEHGSRSGRSAWQFARDYAGRIRLEKGDG